MHGTQSAELGLASPLATGKAAFGALVVCHQRGPHMRLKQRVHPRAVLFVYVQPEGLLQHDLQRLQAPRPYQLPCRQLSHLNHGFMICNNIHVGIMHAFASAPAACWHVFQFVACPGWRPCRIVACMQMRCCRLTAGRQRRTDMGARQGTRLGT